MSEIDGMDMLGFLRVRAWSARKEKRKSNRTAPISIRCGNL